MKNESKFLVKDLNLTDFTKEVSKKFVKKSGMAIKITDMQGYVRRGFLPRYMGGNLIQVEHLKYGKLYSLLK